ncbi:FkbM family methyltransferase [Muricoccus radiodurans]|uniref:FkbM family methyltransferase n=1 Tax=Muricoccus radiodurans TaxID=2231721 RepID=UPI003CEBF0A2
MALPDSSRGRSRLLQRWIGRLAPRGLRASGTAEIAAALRAIEARLARLEEAVEGSRGTYLGDGIVLAKTVIHGAQFAFLLEAEDRLLTPWLLTSGHYEDELTDHFVRTRRPDDRCLDVGANFGYFTCLFARFCPRGMVLGVEPDARVFSIARDNILANGLAGVASLRQAAVCEAERELTLNRRMGRSGNTSIAPVPLSLTEWHGEKPAQPFQVMGTTVDRLAEAFGGRLDVMKVDVEGAEPLVLAGASRTVSVNPGLQIVMEWSPGQMVSAGFDIGGFLDDIDAMGLRCHGLGPGRPSYDRDAMLNLSFANGILLTREPRA